MVVVASVQERDGAEKLFALMNGKYPRLEKVLADQGFSGEEFTKRIRKTFGFVLEIVKKVLGGERISSVAEKMGCRKDIWLVDVQSAISQRL